MKMPPVGNFAPPPSAVKDSKKRRGGAGSQITGGAAAVESTPVNVGQNNKNGSMRGNANKVCFEFKMLGNFAKSSSPREPRCISYSLHLLPFSFPFLRFLVVNTNT